MVLFIHDNYDAGCSAHRIKVVMNEQHHCPLYMVPLMIFLNSTRSLLC